MTSDPKVRLFPGGPEFPAEFLDAVQKGEAVFFCGAGLSMGTGLPDFPDLVRELDGILNPDPNDRFDKGRTDEDDRKGRTDYDRMLSELEDRFVSGRMRKHARDILSKPPQDPKGIEVLENHRNILTLAKTLGGGFRLVTTNFDDRFARAAKGRGWKISFDDAPKLPVPESPRWSSLVHLHGRICEGGDLSDLVLTAADFGRAYLSEGWARRFVVRLMRRWPVAFVGYGLNDPPMRYLMDAVRDPRGNPEEFKQAFALVGCGADEEEKLRWEWKNKRVIPILYDDADDHAALRPVLRELARLKDEPNYRAELAVRGTDGNPDDEGGDNGRRVVWALRNLTAVRHFVERKLMDDGDRTAAWAKSFDGAGMLRAVKSDADALSISTPQPLTPAAKLLVDWLCWHMQHEQILRWMEDYCDFPHPYVIERASRRVRENAPVIPEELREKWALFLLGRGMPDSFTAWRMAGFSSQVNEVLEEKILESLRPSVGGNFTALCPLITPDGLRSCAMRGDFPGRRAETLFGYLEQMARAVSRQGVDWSSRPLSTLEEDKKLEFRGPHIEFMERLSMKAIRQLAGKGEVAALKNRVDRWAESEILRLIRMALFAIAECPGLSASTGVKILKARVDDLRFGDCAPFLRQAKGRLTPPMLRGMERAFMRPPQDKVVRRLRMLEQSGLQLSPKAEKIVADARAEYENSALGPQEVEVKNMSADKFANTIQGIPADEKLPDIGAYVRQNPERAVAAFELLADAGFWKPEVGGEFVRFFAYERGDGSEGRARRLLPLLRRFPDDLLFACAGDAARILESAGVRQFSDIEETWRKLWSVDLGHPGHPPRSMDGQINWLAYVYSHPHGILARVASDILGGEEDFAQVREAFEEILRGGKPAHFLGQSVVAEWLPWLFCREQEWTVKHLLPEFASQIQDHMWIGYLGGRNGRLDMPPELLARIKHNFLLWLKQAEDLPPYGERMADLFVHAGVEISGVLSDDECKLAGDKMSPEMLVEVCKNICGRLRRRKDETLRAKKWRESIGPFLRSMWPEKRLPNDNAQEVSRWLASVVMLTGDAFPDAFEWARDFLTRIPEHQHMGHPISDPLNGMCGWTEDELAAKIPAQSPLECLLFLDRIIPDEGFRRQYDLRAVLDKIQKAAPALEKRPEFRRLREIASGG